MVKDNISNISNYYKLDDRLTHFSTYREERVENYLEFKVENDYSSVFIVEKGSASFATGWRKNRENREVTAVARAGEGDFVLYLPGEPIAVALDQDSVVTRRRLK